MLYEKLFIKHVGKRAKVGICIDLQRILYHIIAKYSKMKIHRKIVKNGINCK